LIAMREKGKMPEGWTEKKLGDIAENPVNVNK
jgi:hypothetical protein